MGVFLLNRSLYLPFLNNEIALKINWISYAFIGGFLSLRGQTKATLPLPNPSPTPPPPNQRFWCP